MIDKIIDIAKGAGNIIMKYYKGQYDVKTKKDKHDFVTTADLESQKYIVKRIKDEFPDDMIMCEESNNVGVDFSKRVWVVDPLDGTGHFMKKRDSFSVCISLCLKGIPFLGVVYAPVRDELYFAEKGKGAFLRKNGKDERLRVSKVDKLSEATLIQSKSVKIDKCLEEVSDSLQIKKRLNEGSTALKILGVATGKADFFISLFPNINKWDTCAAQVILEEAGGIITDPSGNPLNYRQEECYWEDSFIASNGVIHKEIIDKIKAFKK